MGSKETSNYIYDYLFRNTPQKKAVSSLEQEEINRSVGGSYSNYSEDGQEFQSMEGIKQIQHYIAAENLSETLKVGCCKTQS